jgi:hypothetical protein
MSGIVEIAALAAAVGFVIVTQVRGQSLQARRLVLLPAILIVIGLAGLHGMTGVSPADIACITVGALIAATIGLAQGAVTRLQSRNGTLWGRLPVWGLWLWAALIVSRVAMMVAAHAIDAEAAASLDSVLVVLGINRLAQAGVIASRAARAGLPLAH